MIAVSNTSPLIFLAKVKKIGVLCKLFSRVLVPSAVWDELTAKPYSMTLPACCRKEYVTEVANLGLGAGETHAIHLAKRKNTPYIILDDHQARKAAQIIGLHTIGTLGILLLFLKKKFMSSAELRSALDVLVQSNFHVSVELYSHVLREAAKYEDKL